MLKFKSKQDKNAALPAPKITIRAFGEDEAAAYWEIYLEGLKKHPDILVEPLDLAQKQAAKTPTGRFHDNVIFGAYADDALIGCIKLRFFHAANETHKGCIWGLYVRDNGRGLGIGTKLFEACIAEAKNRGIEMITTRRVMANEASAGLMQKMKFKPYAIEPRWYKIDNELTNVECRVRYL